MPARPVNVVLVHGIYDRGRIFAPLVRVLEAQGCRCLAPSLTPNDCRDGVHALTRQLSVAIDARFGPSAPVVLVGFSLGGLVSRDYVQTLARPGRVRGVLLISPPNHGTLWACFARGGTRDLGWGSRFLRRLNGDERAWRHVAVRTYWTPLDLMIVPATSSLWSVGDTKTIFCVWHPWMVKNPALMADVAARIADLTMAQGSATGDVPFSGGGRSSASTAERRWVGFVQRSARRPVVNKGVWCKPRLPAAAPDDNHGRS